MAAGSSEEKKKAFANAFHAFLLDHKQRGRGAQAWLRKRAKKSKSQIKYWLSGEEVPGNKAIRDVIAALKESGVLSARQEKELTEAWDVAYKAVWDDKVAERNQLGTAARKAYRALDANGREALVLILNALALKPALIKKLLVAAGAQAEAEGLSDAGR